MTLIQNALVWEDKRANLAAFDAIIEAVDNTDVIVLPEMFATGFSMDSAALAEPMGGPVVTWMARWAAGANAVVAGSVIVEESGRYFNRFVWQRPDGSRVTYDKRHLFRMTGEHRHYTPGESRTVVSWRDWRICPQICYDLRFPAWTRNRQDYDLLLVVANWPAARRDGWRVLMRARAIENLAYAVGVNRVGLDGRGTDHAGDSLAVDFAGNVIVDLGGSSAVTTVAFDRSALVAYRDEFPAHLDADEFSLLAELPGDPGKAG